MKNLNQRFVKAILYSTVLLFVLISVNAFPDLNVSIPQYTGSYEMDISGSAPINSTVKVYVNDVFSRSVDTSNGNFKFYSVRLTGRDENKITLVSFERGSENDNYTRDFIVKYDIDLPQLRILNWSNVSKNKVLELEGQVTENSTITVLADVNGNYSENMTIEVNSTFNIKLNLNEGLNNVRFIVTDKALNSVDYDYTVLLDTAPPKLELDYEISKYSPSYSKEITLSGNVSEKCTVYAIVNGQTYSVQSDDNNRFSIEIELEKRIEYSDESTEGTGIETGIEGEANFGGPYPNRIKVYATDLVGQNSTPVKEGTVDYKLCGEGGDWSVQIDNPVPQTILPNMVSEGMGMFSFHVNLEYRGSTKGVIKSKPLIRKFTDISAVDKRTDLDVDMISRVETTFGKKDFTKGYAIVWLKAKPMAELENKSSMKFPLMIEIPYAPEEYGKIGNAVREKQCITITLDIDREALAKNLPKGFLKSTINFLNSTVNTLDKVINPLKDAEKYLFYTCMAASGYRIVEKTSEVQACVKYASNKFIPPVLDPSDPKCDQDCKACLEAKKKTIEARDIMTWSCDRLACPSIPSVSEYSMQNQYKKGLYYAPKQDKFSTTSFCIGENVNSQLCEDEYNSEWRPACLGVSNPFKMSTESEEDKVASLQNSVSSFIDFSSKMCNYKEKTDKLKVTTAEVEGQKISFSVEQGKVNLLGSPEYTYVKEGTLVSRVVDDKTENVGQEINDVTDNYQFYVQYKEVQQKRQKSEEETKWMADNKNRYNDINSGKYTFQTKDGKTVESSYGAVFDSLRAQNVLGNEKEKYVLDPTSGLLRSAQCGCVPAMVGYLNDWRTMLDLTNKCLNTVMMTGETRSGFCRAVLTMYVCDLVYDSIRCIGSYYTDKGSGTDVAHSGNMGFLSALGTASGDIKSSIDSRYGGTQLYKTMFIDRKLINSACLAAFGADWDAELEGMLSQSLDKIPRESEVFVYPATRRFMGYNPTKGLTNFMYHIGVGIVAGADINYKIELVCSNDNSCDVKDGFVNNECDCMRRGEPVKKTVAQGRLSNGDTFWEPEGDLYKLEKESPVRFDTVVVSYMYKDNNGQETTKTVPVKISPINVNEVPLSCNFDIATLEFRCEFDMDEEGYAKFTENPLIKRTFETGQTLTFDVNLEKMSPGFDPEDETTQIPKYLSIAVYNKYNRLVDNVVTTKIMSEGVSSYKNLPGLLIQKKHFARYSDIGQGTISATDNTDDNYVSKDSTGTYSSNIKFTAKYSPSAGNKQFLVTYDGIDRNPETVAFVDTELGFRLLNGEIIVKFDNPTFNNGNSFEVNYIAPAYVTQDADCPSTQTWTAKVSLLNSVKDESGNYVPGEVINYEGDLQERSIEFKVICKVESEEKTADAETPVQTTTPATEISSEKRTKSVLFKNQNIVLDEENMYDFITLKKQTTSLPKEFTTAIFTNYDEKISPELIMAVSMHESGWGMKYKAKYNLWGIKCSASDKDCTTADTWECFDNSQTGTCYNNRPATTTITCNANQYYCLIKAGFKNFLSYDDGVKGFIYFLESNPRYANALMETDIFNKVKAINDAGYATDKAWYVGINSIITQYYSYLIPEEIPSERP